MQRNGAAGGAGPNMNRRAASGARVAATTSRAIVRPLLVLVAVALASGAMTLWLASVTASGGGGSGSGAGEEPAGVGPSAAAPLKILTLRDMLRAGRLPMELLEHEDVDFCENITEPEAPQPIPSAAKVLMIIGTQKTGTTWLFRALLRHPAFVPTYRLPGSPPPPPGTALPWGGLLSKEPKFFNRWPLPPTQQFLDAFPPATVAAMLSGAAPDKVLLDGSPQYLVTAAAAPRIKAIVPHARFVVVIRDAPMRTFSDWAMMSRVPNCANGSRMCARSESFVQQVELELADDTRSTACDFTADSDATWFDCFKCSFTFIPSALYSNGSVEECAAAERFGPPGFNCSDPGYRFIDHGMYAAQLAWWLRFFPPERFVLVSQWQLRDREERVRVLNRIVRHAGADTTKPFTAEQLDPLSLGFKGWYSRANMTNETEAGLELLRQVFQPPQQDLLDLVRIAFPGENFTLKPEDW